MKSRTLRGVATIAISSTMLVSVSAFAQENDETIEEIVVTAQKANQTQVMRGGNLGALGDKDALDVPFAIKSYGSTLILNQQSQSLGQVLENDPSVRTTYGFANASEQFVIRGFPLLGEDIAIDGLYGLTPRQLVSPELYDQVQILNGASAFLFGAAPGGSALGGTVNLTPKRAGGTPVARATVNYNSDEHFGGAFDLGRRFGEDDAFGVRVNGAGRWGDVAIEDEYRSSAVLGVGLDWRSDRTRLSLDLAYQRAKVRHMRPMVQLDFGVAGPIPRPPEADTNYGQPWNFTTLRDIFGIVKFEHDLSENFMLYAAGGARDSAERGNYQSLFITNVATGAARATGARIPRNDNNEAAQAGIRGKLATGPLTHEINVGVSAIRQVNRNAFAFGSFVGDPTNIYDPVATPEPDFSFFVGGDVEDPFPISRTRLSSLFASDTIGLLDDRVSVSLGLRRQNIRILSYSYFGGARTAEYDESATTPVVGIVVKPTDRFSIYANRIQGLTQGAVAPGGTSNAGEVFPPFKSTQYELGAKLDLGRWNASVAAFQTRKPTGIVPLDPDPTDMVLPTFAISGQQRNRGIEFSFDGEPTDGLRIIAGLSVNDAKLRKTQGGLNNGNEAIGVPDYTANANVEWDLPFIAGTTLTARVVRTGEQFYDDANTLGIPEWTRFDLGARYVTVVADRPVTFRLNVDNVADKRFWSSSFGGFGGQLVQGLPRTVKLSATVDF